MRSTWSAIMPGAGVEGGECIDLGEAEQEQIEHLDLFDGIVTSGLPRAGALETPVGQ